MSNLQSRLFILAGFLICLFPLINPAIALLLGAVAAIIFGNPEGLQKFNSLLLKISIVLLGFGLNWTAAVDTSVSGIGVTAVAVFSILLVGIILGKWFKINGKTTLLISVGTAICGGSAIATISPIIQAKEEQLTFAMIVVFVLNGVALFTLPVIGEWTGLSQKMFGVWVAVAIHDTSSVMGAGEMYGEEALQIAVTTKLIRALWIVPMAVVFCLFEIKKDWKEVRVPWFILLFILAILIAHYFPRHALYFDFLNEAGKKGMIAVLFYAGASFNLALIRKAGTKYFLFGFILWLIVSVGSFFGLSELTWFVP